MPASKLPVAVVLAASLSASAVFADLRGASHAKNVDKATGRYNTIQQGNAVKFIAAATITYCEPSTFNYQGLINQRQNNYDNFVRSNIDNEQDNRNFNTEPGKDHLPFRTLEAGTTGGNCSIPTTTMTPGQAVVFPLRWNNPHASELEANVWLMATNPPVVVPVLQPVCSGEGIQDSAVGVTIPSDFNSKVRSTVPGFNGCVKQGDCVLQLYAHSVETRQYAIGIPLIVTGYDASVPAAKDDSAILPATEDVQYNLDALPRKTCLAQTDPSANIASAVPRRARLISDVANHAYQNSDYSPYSGQQPTRISRNMQAAALVRMVISNGGELGQTLRTQAQKDLVNKLANKVNGLVAAYEKAADEVIKKVGETKLKATSTLYGQATANCFRCPDKLATNTNRQNTQTYIPSFTLPQANVAEARSAISNANIRNTAVAENGDVLIYETVLNQVRADFKAAEAQKIVYLDAVLKSTISTLADVTQFRKLDANGKQDGGKYAAAQFYKSQAEKPSSSPSASSSIAASASPSSTPAPSEVVLASPEPGAGLIGNPDDTLQQDAPLDGGSVGDGSVGGGSGGGNNGTGSSDATVVGGSVLAVFAGAVWSLFL